MAQFKILLFSFFLVFMFLSCSEIINTSENHRKSDIRLPNIILIVGDDQGYPYFGFMGADYVHTPNMDSLAMSGVLFTNGYVPENHCRPSLQTLVTGILPTAFGYKRDSIMNIKMLKGDYKILSKLEKEKWKINFNFHAMKYFQTLPKILKTRGYTSFQGGKWWEFSYQNGGFSEGMTTGWEEEEQGKKGWFYQFMGGEGRKLVRSTMNPVYNFMENNSNKPFFIWFAPELPHYPLNAPERYYNLYKEKHMTESAKRYYANCTWFDYGIGELKQFIRNRGELENTMFIYVNDNGWEQNSKQEFRGYSVRWHNGGDKGKLSMYDQSFRTPIIFSWKGNIDEGIVYDHLIHSADISATIMDYLNIPLPKDIYGRSYKQIIKGQSTNTRNEIIGKINQIRSEQNMMGEKTEVYWLRYKNWFFNWNPVTKHNELYNMANDPFNNINVSYKYPALVKELKMKIYKWQKINEIFDQGIS